MQRIADPLSKMNANIQTTNGSLPMTIEGRQLIACNISLEIPSAQIKSGLMLASLNANGETSITENKVTRDHTETMLKYFGADIQINKVKNKKIIKIRGKKELMSNNIDVPNDLSSSAFFIIQQEMV